MDKNLIIQGREKYVDGNMIEDKFELHSGHNNNNNNNNNNAKISYKYLEEVNSYNGSITFEDKFFSIFYDNGEFSNGLCKGIYIKPEHSIDGFMEELTKHNLDSSGLRDRIGYVQSFIRTQDDKILKVYQEFLNMK